MKKLFVIIVSVVLAHSAIAQNKTANSLQYRSAVGIKVWNGIGLNLKTFVSDKNALEFVGFFNSAGTRISGLYEMHGGLNTEGNLKWYLGFGGDVGLYKGATILGVDGVIGIDYKFKDQPINIALDWQPSLEFGTGYGFNSNWGGFAIRYTL